MQDFQALRREMVELQIAARGVRDEQVLEAVRTVPREAFVPERLAEFAYEDTPLPIEAEQTISQPYIVALMAEALEIEPGDCVLEVGAGSGYAAAVLGRIAGEVWAVERHEDLARGAAERIERLGYTNVQVVQGDGTLGLPQHAPYDAIAVAAGGPEVPPALVDQLAPGGRLVIPVGSDPRLQELVRIRKDDRGGFSRENLGGVRFVPLIGAQGWSEEEPPARPAALHQSNMERRAVASAAGEDSEGGGTAVAVEAPPEEATRAEPARLPDKVRNALRKASSAVLARPGTISTPRQISGLLREAAEPFDDIEDAELGPLLDRIGDSRLVLLGEATHGTSEFYRMRARITRELVRRKGFNVVAVEADWPDASRVDRYIRPRRQPLQSDGSPTFGRFPTWMWRNREVQELVHWLREHNDGVGEPERKVSFHGLDLYSLHSSIHAVTGYLDRVDPEAARLARLRYGCLTPWEQDPALYGEAALMGRYETCEPQVIATLVDMLQKQMEYEERDAENYLEALQNARVAANAERYYRVMYYGSRESWNLRDQHMFDTLETVLRFRGADSKAIVWAHNSHLGNAAATEMGARGEFNVGQLARDHYGRRAYLVGFGTDHGTVAAATNWDEEMQVKNVRPSHPESYERLCHDTGLSCFLLHLREPSREAIREELQSPRLERAIGVIYRPETELMSHYFHAVLPWQFDEYIWFDQTHAVTPLAGAEVSAGMPETYPFGL